MIATIPHPFTATAEEVLALVRCLCTPLPAERVTLGSALHRVLRERVHAPEDQPLFDRSSVDGYAVRLNETRNRLRVVDEIRAGDWKPRQLQPGEAVRIATGGALPGGGLRVVMREDTQREDEFVDVFGLPNEHHIRFRGEDAHAGQLLVEPGTVLSPGALALLASVGCAQPLVTRLPVVEHVATGNEIVPPEHTPGAGQIRDSNSALVRAFLGEWGITPGQRRVPEDELAALTAIANAQSPSGGEVDLLLISGGASVGEQDFTREVLEALGFTIHVSKTTARPGKPLIVAQRGSTLAFGLPGNPLAHFVCLNLYVRAALEAWAGQSTKTSFTSGVLARPLAADGNARQTFWPAHVTVEEGTALLMPLRWASSGDLTSLAAANALIRVAGGANPLDAGSPVDFVPTGRTS